MGVLLALDKVPIHIIQQALLAPTSNIAASG